MTHAGLTVWFTGVSAAGKVAFALRAIQQRARVAE
jgi:adenylylsulfate kinase-like enzyme